MIRPQVSRMIGFAIQDMLVASGHPLTCNGGNPGARYHDHEVMMELTSLRTLVCPECHRIQTLPVWWT